MPVNIVVLWAVCSFFLRPHYRALFLLSGTSANHICEAGAKAGNQVCRRTRPKCYTETPRFSGRTVIPPSPMTVDGSVRLTRWLCFAKDSDKQKLVNCQFNLLPICLFCIWSLHPSPGAFWTFSPHLKRTRFRAFLSKLFWKSVRLENHNISATFLHASSANGSSQGLWGTAW